MTTSLSSEPRAATDPLGGEYGPPQLGGAWPLLSWLCFLAALGSRFLVRLVPRDLRPPIPWRVLLPGTVAIVLALLGVGFALLGLRRGRGARWALLVNAVVVVLGLLLLAAVFWILPPMTLSGRLR